MEFRIGHGYDLHRLVIGRRLILGGIAIPYSRGLAGHSDGDVLCHAIADAILGGATLGDIGQHFPDTDKRNLGIASTAILAEVVKEAKKKLWRIGNIDATVIAESPKLAEYIPKMRERLSHVLRIPADDISIKAKTDEGLGAVGEGKAIKVHAVVLLVR